MGETFRQMTFNQWLEVNMTTEEITYDNLSEEKRTYLVALGRIATTVGSMHSLSNHAKTGHTQAVNDVLDYIEILKFQAIKNF